MNNIVFIGMPGAGKTTIGRRVAQQLKRPMIDSDDQLREMIGRDIKELFRESEERFRDAETKAIRLLSQRDGIIIACGGGVVKRAENITLLKERGTIFFLDRRLDAIARSVDQKGRPLLNQSADRLQQLYRERYKLYCQAADFIIPVTEGVEETAQQILSIIKDHRL